MQNKIGVMQGRLLPKHKGRFQAHPVGYWQNEFPLAAELGLECIEFIFEYEDFEANPIWSDKGIKEIQQITKSTSVEVLSVCADFFMECPLHSSNQDEANFALSTMIRLLEQSNALGISDLIIPCVDQSSINHRKKLEFFKRKIEELIPTSLKHGVRLCLETDLPPKSFGNLLKDFDSSFVTVNYDTGNSFSLGYDFKEELAAYGNSITDLHIKDRTYGGGSVPLGEGGIDFEEFFSCLSKINFEGIMILQAYRDDEGLEIFTKQLNFIKKILSHHY
jgi:L-ribulose-5-phosphate 3-epimerase